jgi:hypothetical protein
MTSIANGFLKMKRFILENIQVYKSLPTLWDVKIHEYSNRQKKEKMHMQFHLTKTETRYPEATEDIT